MIHFYKRNYNTKMSQAGGPGRLGDEDPNITAQEKRITRAKEESKTSNEP